jgi:hypothetical protein
LLDRRAGILKRCAVEAFSLLFVALIATVPVFVSGQNVSLSIRRFDVLPTRVFQNERVQISLEIENTGGSVASAVQVEVSSDQFVLSNPTSVLGDLSPGQRKPAEFDAQANPDAPTTSKVTAHVSSANGGSFTQIKDVIVWPFKFSVSDPSKSRLTKNEVAEITFRVMLESHEAINDVKFPVDMDEAAFEVVKRGGSYPSIPAGTFTESVVIRSRNDAASKNYPIEIQLVFTDQAAKESHKFVSIKSVYISWCTIWALTAHTDLAPLAMGLIAFRDSVIMRTKIGSLVLSNFYRAYGLFAPTATDVVRSNSYIENAAELVVRPLILILTSVPSIYSLFSFEPELGVLTAGIVAIGLLVAFYVGAPSLAAICIFRCTSRLLLEPKRLHCKNTG